MDKIKSVLSLQEVQRNLVYLYQQSQSECTKNGKLSMEIGTSREKDLIAVLHYHMGDDVEYNVGVHAPEDIKICGQKFSIKHSSSSVGKGSIKWKWTSDAQQATNFKEQLMSSFTDKYYSNMILVYIDASSMTITIVGVLKDVIIEGVKNLMEQAFVSRTGTNNRGVEFSPRMIKHIITNATFRIILSNINFSFCSDPIQKRISVLKCADNSKVSIPLKKMKLE